MGATYFNKYENITDATRKEIVDLSWQLGGNLAKYIWQLMNGCNYFLTDDFQYALYKANLNKELRSRVIDLYATVSLYPKSDQQI